MDVSTSVHEHVDLDESYPRLAALLNAAAFWMPERLVEPPPWVGHIPFAFWLMQAHRPRCVVELGTHTGNSYSAFCQAVQYLKLQASCFAVDTWKGDPHSGFYGEDIFEEFKEYHDSRYASFSQLIRSTFDEAVGHFSDNSIDVLHIDGMHTYDAVRHDFETWHPKLSRRAVVLFHDVNVRERGFGVWRLWEELTRERPSFTFPHSNGLGILRAGASLDSQVDLLFAAGTDEFLSSAVRAVFSQLGSLCEMRLADRRHRAAAKEREHEALRLREALAAREAELTELRKAEAAAKEREVETLRLREALAAREAELALALRLQEQQRRVQQESKWRLEEMETLLAFERLERAKREAERQALKKSVFRRMTRPLRSATRLFRQQRGSKPPRRVLPDNFTAKMYLELNPDLAPLAACGPRELVEHWLEHGCREGRLYALEQVFHDKARPEPFRAAGEPGSWSRVKIGVLVHIYYPDLWPELSGYLSNLGELNIDLLINFVDGTVTPTVLEQASAQFPNARIKVSPNRGRDIGGFFSLLDEVNFSDYAGFLLLHSKKSPHISPLRGAAWRHVLIKPLAGSPEIARANASLLAEDPTVGIIAAAACRDSGLGDNAALVQLLLDRLGIEARHRGCEFVTGTMFLVRTSIIESVYRSLASLEFENGDHQPVEFHRDGQWAHAVERVFGNVLKQQGLRFVWRNIAATEIDLGSVSDFT